MSKAYRVRSEPEAIDGISCYVLEYPGHDVLWIDAARGYSIVARELIDPESRSILRSLKASEYHEIGDGIWFPSKINLSGTFAPPVSKAAVSAAPQQRSVEFVISILSVKINGAVAASSAAYSPEPGAVRVLDDNRYLQVVPGGSTQLDELADWMRRMNSHDSQLNKARETSKQLKTWALCSLAFALAGVLYLLPRAVSPFDVRGTPPSIRAEIRRVS